MRDPHVIRVPMTRWRPGVTRALDLTGRTWRPAWVNATDSDYFDLLAELWTAGDTFTIVEHDVIVTREALDSFDTCPGDWCASPYPYLWGEPHTGLGCARFRAAILTRHPDLMGVVAEMSDDKHPARHWCRLDAWITNTLTGRGESRCENHPPVAHEMAQRGSAHGCYVI